MAQSAEPALDKGSGIFTHVEGTFYRAVAAAHRDHVLHGSRHAGRYSRATTPTLYMSVSPEGVDAAMIAHGDHRVETVIVALEVVADRIFDLRDEEVCRRAQISQSDAASPWRSRVLAGQEPPSWGVRDRLQQLGANGLIDPSRKAPGLWHLVLFAWNAPGLPMIAVSSPVPSPRTPRPQTPR